MKTNTATARAPKLTKSRVNTAEAHIFWFDYPPVETLRSVPTVKHRRRTVRDRRRRQFSVQRGHLRVELESLVFPSALSRSAYESSQSIVFLV